MAAQCTWKVLRHGLTDLTGWLWLCQPTLEQCGLEPRPHVAALPSIPVLCNLLSVTELAHSAMNTCSQLRVAKCARQDWKVMTKREGLLGDHPSVCSLYIHLSEHSSEEKAQQPKCSRKQKDHSSKSSQEKPEFGQSRGRSKSISLEFRKTAFMT